MAFRDLIPWSRQETRAPALFRGEESRDPILSLRREMDRLFDDAFRGFGLPSFGFGRAASAWPSVELSETGSEIKVTAELPGLTDKDVELSLDDGVLTIRGERRSETEDKDRGYSERYYGRFERRIGLPAGVDEEKVEARFENGVLTVTLPKAPEAERGRRIPINAETRH